MIAILQAATAQTVTAQVQSYYKAVQHVSGTFTELVTNQTFGTKQPSAGKVYAEKPDHARFDYLDNGSLKRAVITDGKDVWIVDPANQKVMTGPVGNSPAPAAIAFLTNGNLAADFTVTLTGKSTLELVPKAKSAMAKLVLVVDPSDGHVTESIVTSSQGDTEDFTWTLDAKATVKSSLFTFNPKSVPTYSIEKLP